ncbi:MAG: hypothetical protein QXV17_08215 [Candidatus Micrarchaeaceae archaeon]
MVSRYSKYKEAYKRATAKYRKTHELEYKQYQRKYHSKYHKEREKQLGDVSTQIIYETKDLNKLAKQLEQEVKRLHLR